MVNMDIVCRAALRARFRANFSFAPSYLCEIADCGASLAGTIALDLRCPLLRMRRTIALPLCADFIGIVSFPAAVTLAHPLAISGVPTALICALALWVSFTPAPRALPGFLALIFRIVWHLSSIMQLSFLCKR